MCEYKKFYDIIDNNLIFTVTVMNRWYNFTDGKCGKSIINLFLWNNQ